VDVIVISALHLLEQKLRREKERRAEVGKMAKGVKSEMDKKAAIGRQANARAEHVIPSGRQVQISKHAKSDQSTNDSIWKEGILKYPLYTWV
jgi:hypothetical protein